MRTPFFRLFIYRNWIGEGMSMNDNEGNTFIYSSRPFWCVWSQMPIRVWHGDIEFGEWLADWWWGTQDISSLVIMTLTVASRAVRALYRVWAVRLHWGRHENTCRGIFILMFCVHIFPLCFDFSSLLWRDKRVLSEELLSRGLKLFSGKTFCNHIKVLVGSPI